MSPIRLAVGERPARVWAMGRMMPGGVDLTVAATIEFPGGAVAQLFTSMATARLRSATVVGDRGVIETSYGNHAPAGESLSLRMTPGTAGGASSEQIELPGGDGFRAEAESFARMVRLGAAEWNGATEAESVDTALTLEAIRTSMREGAWVPLGI